MTYLRVRNWSKFQHYRNRRPIWIKVYTELVQPRSPYLALSIEARGVLTGLWLLAAEYANAIPNDHELIAKLLRTSPEECREALMELKKGRWLLETSSSRRASKSARPEVEKELEEETPQTPLNGDKKEALKMLQEMKLKVVA